jgi:hypothetical protein
MRLLATIDWRSAACTGAMAGIYRRLLEKMAATPRAVLDGRMSLPGKEKALVAVRALSGLDRRGAADRPGAVDKQGVADQRSAGDRHGISGQHGGLDRRAGVAVPQEGGAE